MGGGAERGLWGRIPPKGGLAGGGGTRAQQPGLRVLGRLCGAGFWEGWKCMRASQAHTSPPHPHRAPARPHRAGPGKSYRPRKASEHPHGPSHTRRHTALGHTYREVDVHAQSAPPDTPIPPAHTRHTQACTAHTLLCAYNHTCSYKVCTRAQGLAHAVFTHSHIQTQIQGRAQLTVQMGTSNLYTATCTHTDTQIHNRSSLHTYGTHICTPMHITYTCVAHRSHS